MLWGEFTYYMDSIVAVKRNAVTMETVRYKIINIASCPTTQAIRLIYDRQKYIEL